MNATLKDDPLSDELCKLKRFVQAHTSRFVLGIVHAPSTAVREVVQAVRQLALAENRPVVLYEFADLTETQLWQRFHEAHSKGTVFLLTGLYSGLSDSHGKPVSILNRQRERIAELLPGPTLLVVTQDESRRLFVDAPDFADWRAADFSFYSSQLFDFDGYREFLKSKCSTLPVSATGYDRRLAIWNVFVPPLARKSIPGSDATDGLLQNEELKQFDELFSKNAVSPMLEVIERNRRLVILGNPGSGKTSILKFCVMRWVNQKGDPQLTQPVPFWVELKEYARSGEGLEEYVRSTCTPFALRSLRPPGLLEGRGSALYVDGLDEILDTAARARTIGGIAEFAARHPAARIVVTSRINGYDSRPLAEIGFAHATLENFDDSQIREFLRKWHAITEDDDRQRNYSQSRIESALSASSAIRELAGNPLLLTMLAILNRNQELPGNRVELYREASRLLLHQWDVSRALHVSSSIGGPEKEALLRQIAAAMQARKDGVARNLIDRESLLKLAERFLEELGIRGIHERALALVRELTERNFILSYSGFDHFSFVHITFLEYYCAAWFAHRLEVEHSLSLDELRNDVFGAHWRDATWHEVLRLIAGMIDVKNAEQMILFLTSQDRQCANAENLFLAALCLGEVRKRKAIATTSTALKNTFIEHAIHYEPPVPIRTFGELQEIVELRRRAVAVFAEVWRVESQPWLHYASQFDKYADVRSAALSELAQGWKDDPELLMLLKDRARNDIDAGVRSTALSELARAAQARCES